MLKLNQKIKDNIEKKLNISIKEIQDLTPWELSKHIEKEKGAKLTFSSEFPFIGRGNVLRDGIISSEKINEDIDKVLAI